MHKRKETQKEEIQKVEGVTNNIVSTTAEWLERLKDIQTHLVSVIAVDDGVALGDLVDGFMTGPVATYEGRHFAAMSERLTTVQETRKKFTDLRAKEKKIYLYMVLNNKNSLSKTVRYAVI